MQLPRQQSSIYNVSSALNVSPGIHPLDRRGKEFAELRRQFSICLWPLLAFDCYERVAYVLVYVIAEGLR